MTRCPSEPQLERLLAERLDDAERDSVEAHVEVCAFCQESLGRLASVASRAVPIGGRAEEAAPAEQIDPGFLRRLKELVRKENGHAGSKPTAQQPETLVATAAGAQRQAAGTATSAGTRFRILRPHARGGLGEV